MRPWRATIILLLLVLLGLSCLDLEASREAETIFRFIIDETVVVFVRSCREQSVDLDIEDLELKQYAYFPCPVEVVTGAITNYELRFAAEAAVRKGIFQERINVNPLEIKLDQDGMTGLACLPSSDRVAVNERVVKFIPAVEFPDSLLLFNGCNNTANPTTTAPIAARVKLSKLPPDVLSTGAQVIFTLKFIIIER
jgi:hypothetical protein